MKFPQELIVSKVLPAIRAKLAMRLKETGVTQREIAEILGLTPPAVSQYMSGKRAADYSLGSEYDKYVNKALKYIETKPEKAKAAVLAICDRVQRTEEFKQMMAEL
tara:strand:- start:875 stop:1192 length:318 start_codon:yes stop_codon:yes gene_type:complete